MIICYFSISILPLWVLGTGHVWLSGFCSTSYVVTYMSPVPDIGLQFTVTPPEDEL